MILWGVNFQFDQPVICVTTLEFPHIFNLEQQCHGKHDQSLDSYRFDDNIMISITLSWT